MFCAGERAQVGKGEAECPMSRLAGSLLGPQSLLIQHAGSSLVVAVWALLSVGGLGPWPCPLPRVT